jgi:glycerol dehydrogenase-like iron-containing ADH family enzyme
MALLCGCIVVQDPIDGYTEEDWMHACGIPTKLKGLAYGVENLEYAEQTIQDAAGPIQDILNSSNESVKRFLREMETKSYNTEKCYRYEESPFSIIRA